MQVDKLLDAVNFAQIIGFILRAHNNEVITSETLDHPVFFYFGRGFEESKALLSNEVE